MMGLTGHLSCVYDAVSSFRINFSLMTSLTMIGMGTGHLVRAPFHFPLEVWLVVSVAQDLKW